MHLVQHCNLVTDNLPLDQGFGVLCVGIYPEGYHICIFTSFTKGGADDVVCGQTKPYIKKNVFTGG